MKFRRLSSVVTATLLVCATTASASAQCLLIDEAQVESPYRYLRAFVEALGDAKDANAAIDDKTTVELMLGLRRRMASYRCAESRLAKYQSSSNEAIEASAIAGTIAFSKLAEIQELYSRHLADSIDQLSAGTLKPGSAAERTARIAAMGEEAGSILVESAVAATYAAVAADPATGMMSRLALTTVQRDELLGRLTTLFGNAITNGLSKGISRLDGAAAALYQVLADPKRVPQPI